MYALNPAKIPSDLPILRVAKLSGNYKFCLMNKSMKKTVYYTEAYPAILDIAHGIMKLAEVERFVLRSVESKNGNARLPGYFFKLPPYLSERITALRSVLTRIRQPRTKQELELFLDCFTKCDYSPLLTKKERQLEIWYIGVEAYEREKQDTEEDTEAA